MLVALAPNLDSARRTLEAATLTPLGAFYPSPKKTTRSAHYADSGQGTMVTSGRADACDLGE